MSDGYRKYLINIIPRISKHSEVESILCATPSSINLENDFEKLPNVQFKHCQPFKLIYNKQDIALNETLEKYSPDVVYVPVERYFRFKTVPVVNMIQNMEPFIYPFKGNPVSERIKNLLRIIYAKKALNNADRIIAVSEFVKDFLSSRYGIPGHKFGVVHHGLDISERRNAGTPVPIPSHWQNKFFFTAGSIRPARGLEDALYAIKHLRNLYGETLGIVIAGTPVPAMIRYQEKLIDWIDQNNLSSKVLWAAHLNKSEMAWCYEHCSAFIMTSRVESFGQTAVEAMSHGCLCISANNPCLPEIFGDAAIYYRPMDVVSLSEAVNRISAKNSHECRELSERAYQRSTHFSWEICAQKTVDELKKATGALS